MFEALETGAGLDIVLQMQSTRGTIGDVIATALHHMGHEIFFMILLALVFLAVDKQVGWRMFFALSISSIVSYVTKALLARPRPPEVSSDVVALVEQSGYGLPSGHVFIAIVVFGVVALYYRQTWVTVLFVLYVILQGWARIYTGVHFPQDVIGGLIGGIVTLAAFALLSEPAYRLWRDLADVLKIGLIAVLSIAAVILFAGDDELLTVSGMGIGGLIASMIEPRFVRYQPHPSPTQRFLAYVVGLAVIFIVFYGLRVVFAELPAPDVLRITRYALVAVVALALFPAVMVRTPLATQEAQ